MPGIFKTALEIILYCAITVTFGFAIISTYIAIFKIKGECDDDRAYVVLFCWVTFVFLFLIGWCC